MRPICVLSGILALTLLALAMGTRHSEAAVVYPWCAHYGGRLGGAPNCGFTSFAQCMAAVSGTQGTCEMNPWYELPPQPQPPKRRGLR